MLMVWQQPITDARLLGADGARLAAPDWPSPQVMRDFVRGFGPVARRRRGGHEEFPDESVYASAARALRFYPLAGRFDAASHGPFTPAVAFRRLLCSDRQAGGVCTRVEVGLSTDANRTGTRLRAWAARAWIDAALELAELPVRVATLRGDGPVASTLWSCGPPLADLYQQATTKSDVPLDEARRRLVTPGAPLVLFEYDAAEREVRSPIGPATSIRNASAAWTCVSLDRIPPARVRRVVPGARCGQAGAGAPRPRRPVPPPRRAPGARHRARTAAAGRVPGTCAGRTSPICSTPTCRRPCVCSAAMSTAASRTRRFRKSSPPIRRS